MVININYNDRSLVPECATVTVETAYFTLKDIKIIDREEEDINVRFPKEAMKCLDLEPDFRKEIEENIKHKYKERKLVIEFEDGRVSEFKKLYKAESFIDKHVIDEKEKLTIYLKEE